MFGKFVVLALALVGSLASASTGPIETGSPSVVENSGSNCCSAPYCEEYLPSCPSYTPVGVSQNVQQSFSPAFQEVYPNCPCEDSTQYCYPECHAQQQQYCNTCQQTPGQKCPPHCELYTKVAKYEYPYTTLQALYPYATLSATETCTVTLLNCEEPYQYSQYYPKYQFYPANQQCEYAYPCDYAHPQPSATVTIHPQIPPYPASYCEANQHHCQPRYATYVPAYPTGGHHY